MDELMNARIQSVLKNIINESNTEVDFNLNLDMKNFDEEAFKSLKLIEPKSAFGMQATKRAEIKLLDIDFIPSNSEAEEYFKRLQSELKKVIECKRIARTYGYAVLVGANIILILYFTSHNDFERFNELVKEYTELSKSLNNVLWEEIQYIKYLVDKDENEIITNRVAVYYAMLNPLVRRFLRIVVDNEQVVIYAPAQLMGRVIGRQGAHVKKLQEETKKVIIVKEDIELTKEFAEFDQHDTSILDEVIEKMKKLEEMGITPESVLKLYRSKYPKEEQ
jgi:pyruvate/2-oxoacid:ferredoxin oxidoreductase alpha subunit